MNSVAVDRVAGDERGNRRDPEECLVDSVGNKGADEMDRLGLVAGERDEREVVRSRDSRRVDDGVITSPSIAFQVAICMPKQVSYGRLRDEEWGTPSE